MAEGRGEWRKDPWYLQALPAKAREMEPNMAWMELGFAQPTVHPGFHPTTQRPRAGDPGLMAGCRRACFFHSIDRENTRTRAICDATEPATRRKKSGAL